VPAGGERVYGDGMSAASPTPAATDVLRPHAEVEFAAELAHLAAIDDRPRPVRWRLSPWAVVTYLIGGALPTAPSSRRSTSARGG